jgi:hypothetical protein
MIKRPINITVLALGFAVMLSIISGLTLAYLLNGYSIVIGTQPTDISGAAHPFVYRVEFSRARILVDILLWATSLVGVLLFAIDNPRARLICWLVFLTATAIRIWDVYHYGTMGSPTSLWLLLTLLLLAIAANNRSKLVKADG